MLPFEPAKEKATKDKQNAEKKSQRELNEILSHRRERINFFNSVLVQNLSEDYIALLTDEDQLYLLQSMQERKDAEQLSQNLKNAARVVVGIGILGALFGLEF